MEQNPYLKMTPQVGADNERRDASIFLKSINQENVREDIYQASHNLADYLQAEKIPNVMFLDNSARQAYVGLKEVWKKEQPESPEPHIYFINPKAILDESDFPELEKEFFKKYKNINLAEPILLYDVCIHTGATILKIKDFFKYLGFTDIRLAITSVDENFPDEKKDELDLVCLPNRASLGCNPFSKPTYVKNSNHLVSGINPAGRALGASEHQKIKEVFK